MGADIMQEAYVYTAISLLLIASIATFLYWPWQRICEDIARQKLFEIRDDLFMMAAEGKIAFDDPAYLTIRRYLEIIIRHAHQLSWMSLLGYTFIMPRDQLLHPRDPLGEAVNKIENPELKKVFSQYKDEAETAMFSLMIARSPLLIILTIVVGVFSLIASLIKEGFALTIYKTVSSEAVSLALYDVFQSEKAGVPIRV